LSLQKKAGKTREKNLLDEGKWKLDVMHVKHEFFKSLKKEDKEGF